VVGHEARKRNLVWQQKRFAAGGRDRLRLDARILSAQ
jgi:hypothetical protein